MLPTSSSCVIELKNEPLDCSQTQPRYFIYKKDTCFGPIDHNQAVIKKIQK